MDKREWRAAFWLFIVAIGAQLAAKVTDKSDPMLFLGLLCVVGGGALFVSTVRELRRLVAGGEELASSDVRELKGFKVGQEDVSARMTAKTDAELFQMFADPKQWTPEALEAAREELRRRAIPLPPEPVSRVLSEQERSAASKALRTSGGRRKIIWGILLIVSGVIPVGLGSSTVENALVVVGAGVLIWGLANVIL